MADRDFLLEHLEWETIEPNQIITHLIPEKGTYNLRRDCTITFERDTQYHLEVKINGKTSAHSDLAPRKEDLKGIFLSNENISGKSPDGIYDYKLFNIAIGNHSFSHISREQPKLKFKGKLEVNKIEIQYSKKECIRLQEWYLGGNTLVDFTRFTKRELKRNYGKIRENIDPPNKKIKRWSYEDSRDFIYVTLSKYRFIISKVPKEFGPKWSNNLSIEYSKSFGGIPPLEEREAIAEFVSFIFGTHLLKVGESGYERGNYLVRASHQNPWGTNIISKCQEPGQSPIQLVPVRSSPNIEDIFNTLLPEYLNLRKDLKLKDCLQKYWIAKDSMIGANLPILSSAVETLADTIIKSHPDVKQYYIKYPQFTELIQDEINAISHKLDEYLLKNTNLTNISEIKSKISNKIKGASQRGANEKLTILFEIIGLPISDIERKAINARNKMAHSSIGEAEEDELIEIIRLTRAYETLFHRIILKILGYQGTYVDYYSRGCPERPIQDPIPTD